ncbi:HI1506-related protein [Nitrosomonas communis]|uniref:Mu-like prophage FluMu N-terminal domain-containing protein n=1 Tax=Nitrosomonas communis TaxID=44574 RepID=A0A1I4SRM6_9PROT|nr:HI1506-related protein [Nitrosomonas communis]SFM67114.1 hypothetical protein SAMN05421863_10436 [Nitrosomonas communis]
MATKTEKTTEAENESSAKPKVKALRVRAFNDHFRRAGITFNKEEQIIKLIDLTTEQITQIKSEPMLAVSEIETDE